MWAVRLEDVTKIYRAGGPGKGYDSLGRVIATVPSRVAQRFRRGTSLARAGHGKRVLDRVNLEIEEGDSFALLGANGAGKSTALRVVSHITPPTTGIVRVRGRVGALIEVTSGVHFELTGRENIRLYGAIIGIPTAEIRRRFDEIVEFSGLAHALDTQVKYYSSGMQLRLGFSIASHLEPDVFVVDEALSVGDASFQAKCVERMTKLSGRGTTLIFVSHDLTAVEALCRRAAYLHEGHLVDQGEIGGVMARYLADVEERSIGLQDGDGEHRTAVQVVSASCHGAGGEERVRFSSGDPIEVRLRFRSEFPIERPHVVVGITDGRPDMLIECSMMEDDQAPDRVPTDWECRLRLPELPLRPRVYQVWCHVWAANRAGRLSRWRQVAQFRVVDDAEATVRSRSSSAALTVPYEWTVVH